MKFGLVFLFILGITVSVDCLMCYTCRNEHRNLLGKCTKERIECEPYQDTCSTLVSFYAEENRPRSNRRQYISKGCDTWAGCFQRRRIVDEYCDRKSDKDWSCVECCKGDLCNYYVKLNSSIISFSFINLFLCLSLSMLIS